MTDTEILAKIKEILDKFDWETDDRQIALEDIDDLVNNRPLKG